MPIKKALEYVRKGQNPFNVPDYEAERQLLDLQAKGKTYITGCDNEDDTGRCRGHESKETEGKENIK
jgi:hypothetical protein